MSGWDIGAYEFLPSLTLSGTPGNQVIHLAWTVNTTLPPTSTWRISYYSQTIASAIEVSDLVSSTRVYALGGLTSYAWYTVTLNALLDSVPLLTDTLKLMPSDRLVYLPIALK